MSAGVHSFVLVCIMSSYGVSLATSTGDSHSGTPRGHGDPCGDSPDKSLVCCIGVPGSTLIYDHEECCNGRPVGAGEMCCDETVPIPWSYPEHDSCCLNLETYGAVTYDSRLNYCNPETGNVVRLPFYKDIPNDVSYSQPHNRIQKGSETSSLNPKGSLALSKPTDTSRWCLEESEEKLPAQNGESALCCGSEAYFPSRQTCCLGVLSSIPAKESVCCHDQSYRQGDSGNPCIGVCGEKQFNGEKELCCDGVLIPSTSHHDMCCGKEKISTETHTCCAAGVALPKKGPHSCCKWLLPYVRRYTKCGGDGVVRRKNKRQFESRLLCKRLPQWDPSWPSPSVHHGVQSGRLIKVEGRVSHVSKTRKNVTRVTLSPYHAFQSSSLDSHITTNTTCLEKGAILLIANTTEPFAARRCRRRKLRSYLQGNVLVVFFPLDALSCKKGDRAKVTVPVTSNEHLILIVKKQN